MNVWVCMTTWVCVGVYDHMGMCVWVCVGWMCINVWACSITWVGVRGCRGCECGVRLCVLVRKAQVGNEKEVGQMSESK